MAKQNFEIWCKRAFDYEGRVYENVPGDLGGPTKWGVTIGRLATKKGVRLPKANSAAYASLVADLKALTPSEIEAIYKQDYWDAVRGDDLPSGLDFAVADFGLNSGPSRAAKYLCRCLGKKESGTLSNEVIQAARKADPEDIVNSYCDARAGFLRGIVASRPTQSKFIKGWLSRVRDVRAKSLGLITLQPVTEQDPLSSDVPMPKADPEKPKTKDLVKVSRKARWLQNARRVWNSITWTSILGALGLANDTSGQVKSFISWPVLVTVITVGILSVAFIKYIEALLREDVDEGRAVPSGTETA